jgi:hypothetical protein
MKENTIELITSEFTEMLEATGLSAAQLLAGLLETPIPKRYHKYARIGYKAGWKSIIRAQLKSKPEPKKAKLAEMLAMIRAFKSAPHKMRTLIKQKMKEMPHPPGGPPRKIKLEEERTVCAQITALRAECDTREAIRRVAAKRGVSERTVYRVWSKYNPKKKKSLSISKV